MDKLKTNLRYSIFSNLTSLIKKLSQGYIIVERIAALFNVYFSPLPVIKRIQSDILVSHQDMLLLEPHLTLLKYWCKKISRIYSLRLLTTRKKCSDLKHSMLHLLIARCRSVMWQIKNAGFMITVEGIKFKNVVDRLVSRAEGARCLG